MNCIICGEKGYVSCNNVIFCATCWRAQFVVRETTGLAIYIRDLADNE